ncbi:MAG: DUF3857 domain-containing protein [Bdellovibrio sp.]
MNKLLINLISSCTCLLIFPFSSSGDWAPESSAPYQIVFSNFEMTVDENGLGTAIHEVELQALNDQGRNHLVLQTVPFSDSMQMKVLKASSVTEKVETPVDLKTISVRSAPGSASGVSNLKEWVIPFTNIKVGSVVKYTTQTTHTKYLVKGLFSMQFNFGTSVPELGGKAKIKSLLPLYINVSDPWQVLEIKQYYEGKYYVMELKQKKPLFKSPAEFNPILRRDTISIVDITTMENWNSYAKPIAEKYESILTTKALPEALKKIADNARSKKTTSEKINTITSELSHSMTYAGDWTTHEKMFYPKDLESISKMKVGDCKDFSLATTAILRSLGIKASVAFTLRKIPNGKLGVATLEPLSLNHPSQNTFNHAIVKVQDGKKVWWIDPTNTVSNADYTFNDIAGSYALEISPQASTLEQIPYPEASQSKALYTKEISLLDNNTVDSVTDFELTGEFAKYVLETSFSENEEKAQKVLMTYLRTHESAKSFYEGVNLKSRIAQSIKGKQKSVGETIIGEKEGKKYLAALLSASLQGFLYIQKGRVTDINLQSAFSEKSILRVKGYDFVGLQEGCTIITPWFQVHRSFFKTPDGFEIHDDIFSPIIELSARDANSEKFQMFLGDISSCASTQAVEIVKLNPGETLPQRLKAYTLAEAIKHNKTPGPLSISGAAKALHISNQLLSQDAQNKDLLLVKAQALRRVGYKHSEIDLLEYFNSSEAIVDDLLKRHPQDPQVWQQKTYNAYFKKNYADMSGFFKKTYALSPKNFDLYKLGGDVAKSLGHYNAAIGSYNKALSLAQDNLERAKAAAAMAQVYHTKKDIDKSISYYKISIQSAPEDTWVHGTLMSLLSSENRWDEAIATGEALLKVAPYGVARQNLAYAYAAKSSHQFEEAQKIDPLFIKPESKKLIEQAEKYLMSGLKHDPDNSSCLTTMGTIYFNQAQVQQNSQLALKSLNYFEKAEKSTLGSATPLNFAFFKQQLQNLIKNPRAPASTGTPNKSH